MGCNEYKLLRVDAASSKEDDHEKSLLTRGEVDKPSGFNPVSDGIIIEQARSIGLLRPVGIRVLPTEGK